MANPSSFASHFRHISAVYDKALERSNFDQLNVYSGARKYRHNDDLPYPFHVNTQFKALIPLADAPYSWVIWRPSQKPTLVFLQSLNFWYAPPSLPEDGWLDLFDVVVIRSPEEARPYVTTGGNCAFLGEPDPGIASWNVGERNPESMIHFLAWFRSYKTPYEVSCIEEANRISAKGHCAAREVFYQGGSEFEVSEAFQLACSQGEDELAYPSVIGINEHAAILHYIVRDRKSPPKENLHSMLIDAGASFAGYASDVTRTYAFAEGMFKDMIVALDREQRGFVDRLNTAETYQEANIDALTSVAALLKDFGVIKCCVDTALELGVVQVFMPHGISHFLGLQVHDVGGQQAGLDGELPNPDSRIQTANRLHRKVEPGHVVTVEPGIYFIETLLKQIAESRNRGIVDWDVVEQLRPYGGIRIEDNIAVSADGVVNLTRDAFGAV
ncbi:Xaa-Pro dipeptidase [Parahaliea mediterranea]|uniref:Xaa-Pro dipeptidase n=1 Tax=Parahaliea mediterranea TaxID=651086 RepID=A0A939DE67_9GAMM|nr:Xaa-Pro dipeptidase [Parahaliea mediterranea]MBN7796551.1 Xaa-Pro dipeptidase [Parahaliea mediterranea]